VPKSLNVVGGTGLDPDDHCFFWRLSIEPRHVAVRPYVAAPRAVLDDDLPRLVSVGTSSLPDESHRLRPDHHPTPFSAAEIRDAFVLGRIVRSLMTRGGGEPVVHVRKNLAADDEAGTYEVWTEAPDGTRQSEPEQGRSTWLDLQRHASMPADATTIEPLTFEVPMGRYEGLRYTRIDGAKTDTFWFAMSLPGAPVRIEYRVGDEVVFSSIAISEQRP
jgi:hypothetical protein